jgi:mannose-1-phosphate guanylyltransferase/mannose-6-phosphate isomerase
MLYPVILAGGSGTRLWPWSRNDLPKQFLSIDGQKSLLQNCLDRVKDPQQFHVPYIVINHKHINLLKTQTANAHLLIEPQAKGTAPAITLAALTIHQQDKNAVLLVMPADIHIENNELFCSLLRKSEMLALKHNKLLLFGTQALYPETGYGYIKCGKRISRFYEMDKFMEKPSLAAAKKYITAGYLWNSGIFIFPVNLLLTEIKKHAPEIYHACNKAYTNAKIDPLAFNQCPVDSIDYAVLEKSLNIAVMKCNIGWHDIGSWQAMYNMECKNAEGNILKGEVIVLDCKNTHVINENPKELISLFGCKNLTVVKSGNATIILPRKDSQKVKEVVDWLKKYKKKYN